MSTKKEELVAIAREGGYEGDMPGTTAEAIKVAAGYVGGGGSGGGGNLVKVKLTFSSDQTSATADKTNKEIYDLCSDGALINFDFGGRTTTEYTVVQLSSDAYQVDILSLFRQETSLKALAVSSVSTSASNKAYTTALLS
jgi:hypothetical protein